MLIDAPQGPGTVVLVDPLYKVVATWNVPGWLRAACPPVGRSAARLRPIANTIRPRLLSLASTVLISSGPVPPYDNGTRRVHALVPGGDRSRGPSSTLHTPTLGVVADANLRAVRRLDVVGAHGDRAATTSAKGCRRRLVRPGRRRTGGRPRRNAPRSNWSSRSPATAGSPPPPPARCAAARHARAELTVRRPRT